MMEALNLALIICIIICILSMRIKLYFHLLYNNLLKGKGQVSVGDFIAASGRLTISASIVLLKPPAGEYIPPNAARCIKYHNRALAIFIIFFMLAMGNALLRLILY